MSLTQQAYRELRQAIISLRIKPGERLDADLIGASLGSSRTPVVEALNMLRSEGLVVSRRRVGTFASQIGKEQIEEVFDAREMIEQRVAPVVIHNVSDRQLDALEKVLEEAATLNDPSGRQDFDYTRFMELDALFHSEFVRLSERKVYQKWFNELAAHMQRVRYLFGENPQKRSLEGQKEHADILAALRRRNVDELRAALLHHTRRSWSSAARVLDKN